MSKSISYTSNCALLFRNNFTETEKKEPTFFNAEGMKIIAVGIILFLDGIFYLL